MCREKEGPQKSEAKKSCAPYTIHSPGEHEAKTPFSQEPETDISENAPTNTRHQASFPRRPRKSFSFPITNNLLEPFSAAFPCLVFRFPSNFGLARFRYRRMRQFAIIRKRGRKRYLYLALIAPPHSAQRNRFLPPHSAQRNLAKPPPTAFPSLIQTNRCL